MKVAKREWERREGFTSATVFPWARIQGRTAIPIVPRSSRPLQRTDQSLDGDTADNFRRIPGSTTLTRITTMTEVQPPSNSHEVPEWVLEGSEGGRRRVSRCCWGLRAAALCHLGASAYYTLWILTTTSRSSTVKESRWDPARGPYVLNSMTLNVVLLLLSPSRHPALSFLKRPIAQSFTPFACSFDTSFCRSAEGNSRPTDHRSKILEGGVPVTECTT